MTADKKDKVIGAIGPENRVDPIQTLRQHAARKNLKTRFLPGFLQKAVGEPGPLTAVSGKDHSAAVRRRGDGIAQRLRLQDAIIKIERRNGHQPSPDPNDAA